MREIFALYCALGCVRRVKETLEARGLVTAPRVTRRARPAGGRPFSRGHLYRILSNPIYLGKIAHKGAVFPGQHPPIVDEPTWNAVQAQLAENRQGRRERTNCRNPSLLADLVFDAQDQRLTPTHAKKGSKRYRYYPEPPSATPIALVHQLVERITVSTTQLQIIVRLETLGIEAGRAAGSTSDSCPDEQPSIRTTVLTLPIQLKRCGMAMRLIVDARGKRDCRGPDPKLVALLTKANQWFARLTAGESSSILSIAQSEKVSSSYVVRVLYLAFLAPDIARAIARGENPITLNAKQLLRSVPLPMGWTEQRERLGFAGDHPESTARSWIV